MPYRLAIALSGWVLGLEPRASRATIWRANQLRHTHHKPIAVKLSPAVLSKRPDHFNAVPKHGTNVPEGIRTPDTRLRRPLLYPTELLALTCVIYTQKRVMGIEPTCPAWKAGVLPLNYTRISQYNLFSLRRGDRT